jgi:hypothetical protein
VLLKAVCHPVALLWCCVIVNAAMVLPRVCVLAADVMYAYLDPTSSAASRRRALGITVIDGDAFTDLCTLPLEFQVGGLAVDHRDRGFAAVDIQSGCARVFEVGAPAPTPTPTPTHHACPCLSCAIPTHQRSVSCTSRAPARASGLQLQLCPDVGVDRVWACVGMCGHVWACVGMCGHVWACVGMCGHVWACVGMWRACGGHVCACVRMCAHECAALGVRLW